jgi:hypothetical protein
MKFVSAKADFNKKKTLIIIYQTRWRHIPSHSNHQHLLHVRSDVLAVVITEGTIFWDVVACLHTLLLDPDDGSSMRLRNAGKFQPDYTASYTTREHSSTLTLIVH